MKTKILHVISSIDPKHGGPVEALKGLAPAQLRAGLSVRVLSSRRPGEFTGLAAHLQGMGIPTELIPPGWGPLVWHPSIPSFVAEAIEWADIVHIHALWESIIHTAARTAIRRQKPFIVRPCGMLDPWSLAQGRLRKKFFFEARLRGALNRASALHFMTETEQKSASPLHLTAPTMVEPNGIDDEVLAALPPKGQFRKHHNIGNAPLLLFLGRLHPKKNPKLLLSAFRALKNPDAILVFAGPDGGARPQLEHEVAEAGLKKRVIFTGLLLDEQKWSALVDADLFILPSQQENFGVTVVEAWAAGIPTLVSDRVNLHDDVSRAGIGSVFPLELNALVSQLQHWLSDTKGRKAAGERAKCWVREKYLWRQIAEHWKAHYQKLIGQKSFAPRTFGDPH